MSITRAQRFTAGVVATLCAATVAAAGPAAAAPEQSKAASVVTEWNAIADRTIFAENATPVPSSALYFGFVHLAMYDAVVSIEGGYEPYAYRGTTAREADAGVAAATAAYRVLRHYFPASAAALAADYTAFLAGVPDGLPKQRGRSAGLAAALTLIQLRVHDGRGAPVTLTVPPLPGVWRPTPPAFAPMAVPELGFVRPLLLESARQFPLPGPDRLRSTAYAADLAEVQAYGARTGSARTEEQTETAMFYSDNVVSQFNAGLREQVTGRGLPLVQAARAFALLGSSTADALIACWRSKFDQAYWRPITAIHEAHLDGNPDTTRDVEWLPLLDTPPYPEYASGHACATGAATGALGYLFGADRLDLTLSSAVTGSQRHYGTADAVDQETMDARVWLGFHFRRAMTDGSRLGHAVADWAAAEYLRPTA